MRKILANFAVMVLTLSLGAFAQQPRPGKPDNVPAEKKRDKTLLSTEKSGATKKAGPGATAAKPSDKLEGGIKIAVPTETEKLLDEAIAKIEAIKQFQTDVRQVTEMLGYTIRADGRYALAPDFRMLLEMKVQLTDTTGSMKEVCDGKKHWRSKQVLDSQELIKIDLDKVRAILDKPDFKKEVREQLIKRLGFSGVLPLMRAVRDTQKLDEHEEATLDGSDTPVYVLHGHWREDAIGQANFRGQPLSLANLPAYVPDKTTVWIGKEDGWPYRLKLESTKKFQGAMTTVTVDFANPQIGVELPDSVFDFEPPPGVTAQDQTETWVQQLSALMRQADAAAQKDKEKASGGGSAGVPLGNKPPVPPSTKPATSAAPDPAEQPKAK